MDSCPRSRDRLSLRGAGPLRRRLQRGRLSASTGSNPVLSRFCRPWERPQVRWPRPANAPTPCSFPHRGLERPWRTRRERLDAVRTDRRRFVDCAWNERGALGATVSPPAALSAPWGRAWRAAAFSSGFPQSKARHPQPRYRRKTFFCKLLEGPGAPYAHLGPPLKMTKSFLSFLPERGESPGARSACLPPNPEMHR